AGAAPHRRAVLDVVPHPHIRAEDHPRPARVPGPGPGHQHPLHQVRRGRGPGVQLPAVVHTPRIRLAGADGLDADRGRHRPGSAVLVYGFLFLPVLVMAVFAFKKPSPAALAGFHGSSVCGIPPAQIGNITVWNGFTGCWFSAGLHDPTYIPAIVTSLQIAAE